VIGHHGHTLQEVERYKDKWILYGIGNFMFNSRGRFAQYPDVTPFSLAVELLWEAGDVAPRVRLYPIHSDNQVTNYQPRLATPAEAVSVFDTLADRSRRSAPASRFTTGQDRIGTYAELRM